MGDNISALSASMRPADALPAAGLGQLTSLVTPLQDVLDRMAGNASEVYAFVDAWVAMSDRVAEIQGQFDRAVVVDRHRVRADGIGQSLTEFSTAARDAAAVVQLTAEVVGQSRSAANDLISDMVQRLISLVRHLMAVEGGLTATVLAQAEDLVSTFAKPVANIEQQARTSIANAVKPINDLIAVMGALTRRWDRLSLDQQQFPELVHVVRQREGR